MKRTVGLLAILIFCTAMFAQTQEKEKTLSLSLEDCIAKAVENNLGVAVEVLRPELADISVSSAKEKFLPSLSLDYNARSQNQASYSWLESADETITDSKNYSANFTQNIPTGGNFSVVLSGSKYDTNQRLTSINPRYSTQLRFNFNQPLLKNFGFKTSRREIIIAQNNRDISEINFKESLQNTVYSVEEAYWNLVHSIENLKVQKQSLKLAQDFLERNRRSVEIGTMAPIEILSAQSEVASRQADILDAEAAVKNNEDTLKTIINLAAEMGEEADLLKIVPTETPAYEKKEITFDEALLTAINNRPDLQSMRITLKNNEINLGYAKNQLLPDLSLNASYWSPGVSGTQILFDPQDPFGAPIGEVPGGPSDALRDTFGFKYKNWTLGLTLTIPFNTFFSRANYAQARVNLEQSKLQLENQEQQIFLEIKTAVRTVETNFQRVQARTVARELAQRKLEAEEERLKVGLSTNYIVLQFQRDLATQQTQELRAIIDYNLSLARLNRSLGVTLKEKNIRFSEILGR
jgi:outer membrane protein TolC